MLVEGQFASWTGAGWPTRQIAALQGFIFVNESAETMFLSAADSLTLEAVPEPHTLAMFTLGLAAFAAVPRSRPNRRIQ